MIVSASFSHAYVHTLFALPDRMVGKVTEVFYKASNISSNFGRPSNYTVFGPSADFLTLQEAVDHVVSLVWTRPVALILSSGNWHASASVPAFAYSSLLTLIGQVGPHGLPTTVLHGSLSIQAQHVTVHNLEFVGSGTGQGLAIVGGFVTAQNLKFTGW